MYKLSLLDKISLILVIIGAINWGLIGLFNETHDADRRACK